VQHSYDYALIRVSPRLERGECINVGIVLYCRTKRFLAAPTYCAIERLQMLDPQCDVESILAHLNLFRRVADGDTSAGPIARLPQAERYHWLVAPRSTVLFTSPAHCGLCQDPAHEVDRLMRKLVY
jgi:hypothetical protein